MEFTTELALPGDFYEFTVDAINEGSVDGVVTVTSNKVYEVVDSEEQETTLPDYIKYSVTYSDGTTIPTIGDVLKAGESEPYKVRVEYDPEASVLPDTNKTYKFKYSVTYEQYKKDPNAPYEITFNPNGGTVDPTGKTVEKGSKLGTLPEPVNGDIPFLGWYTELNGGVKVTKDTIPNDDVTYYAHWASSYTTFARGTTVNEKLKKLGASSGSPSWSSVNNTITSFERTTTEPTDGNKTTDHIISVDGQPPIYAWYDAGKIYWYTEATIAFLNEDAADMFYNFRSLNNLDTSFYTNNTKLMYSMFSYISASSLDLSNFDTSNVTDMSGLFQYCSNIVTLDLTSFDTSKTTNMFNMFSNMSSLTTITVSDGFTTKGISTGTSMFYNSPNIVGGRGTLWDSNHTDSSYAHYDYSELNPGYFNAGEVTMSTITFNPNGGTVDPTSKEVITGTRVKELPIPVKEGYDFNGWYTGVTEGTRVTEDTIVTGDVTYYARYYTDVSVIYYGNTGKFSDDTNVRGITYTHSGGNVTKYSHTPNIDDTGVASSVYDNNLELNDVVTIPGAKKIQIELWYATEGNSWDWLAIYPAGVTPTESNYNQAVISNGKLGYHGNYSGYTKPSDNDLNYHKTFIVDGDTAQFYFKSNYSYSYYGYYAIITGISSVYSGDKEYEIPTKNHNRFLGWNTKADGSGIHYNNQSEIIDSIDNSADTITVYAQWEEVVTITFDPNGGTIQDNPTRVIRKGDKIGELPNITKNGRAFTGWYTDPLDGIKIDKNYVPEYDQTLTAHWDGVLAMFDVGSAVNIKLKRLAGDSITGQTTNDTSVREIRKSTTAPDLNQMTDDNIVSASISEVPIYAWFDNGIIYYWSEADKMYTHYDASYMFNNFRNLEYIDTSFDTSMTQNMYYMFADNSKLETIDVSGFNTSNVVSMQLMFGYCSNITSLDLSNFDVRNVTNMDSIFSSMNSLTELNMSNWNFAKYNPGQLMYKLSSYYQSLKKLTLDDAVLPQNMYRGLGYMSTVEEISLRNVDTSRVTVMNYLFDGDNNVLNLDLSSFDTSKVTDMSYMFNYCYNLSEVNLSSFDTSNVYTFTYMFYYCQKLKKIDLSNFDTSKADSFNYMLGYCNNLEEVNLSNWYFRNYNQSGLMSNIFGSGNVVKILKLDNTKYSSTMDYAFGGLNQLEIISLNNVDTSRVTSMYNLFDGSKIKHLDLTSFDTKKVTDMSNMFSYLNDLESITVSDDFVVEQVNSSSNMFYGDTKLIGGNGTEYSSSHIDKEYAHYDHGESDPGYFNAGEVERYLITFVSPDSTLNETSRYVIKGKPIGKLPTPYKNNSTFTGWYQTLPGDIPITEEFIPQSDMTLYAEWTNLAKYTITFDANGGSVNPSSIDVYEGRTISKLPKPTKLGSIFTGWYTERNTGGSQVNDGYKPTESKTLYARWREPEVYTITLDPNGGSVNPTEMQVTEGNEIGVLPTPTWAKHYFEGWYTDLTAGTYVGSSYKPSGNQTIYARWKNIYTVTFNPNGGTVSPTSVDIIEGREIWDLPTPTKQYSKFKRWVSDLTDGIEITKSYRPNADIEVFADWDDVYEITFDPGSGTVNPTKKDIIVGDAIGELPTAKGSGYNLFTGWHLDSSSGTKIDSSYEPGSHLTVYASYKSVDPPSGTDSDSLDQMDYEQQQGRLCTTYPIGMEKTINLGKYGNHKVRLANCTKPSYCSNSNYSQTACGLVWEFTDIITYHDFYPKNFVNDGSMSMSQGGWRDSTMREFINDDIYNEMPSEWKSRIIKTRVISGHNVLESEDYVTIDKMYLLSPTEVFKIDDEEWAYNTDSSYKKTRQLDYYREHHVSSHRNSSDAAKKTARYDAMPSWMIDPGASCTPDDSKVYDGYYYYQDGRCFTDWAYMWYLRNPAHVYGIMNNNYHYPQQEYNTINNFGTWSYGGSTGNHIGVSPAFRTGS